MPSGKAGRPSRNTYGIERLKIDRLRELTGRTRLGCATAPPHAARRAARKVGLKHACVLQQPSLEHAQPGSRSMHSPPPEEPHRRPAALPSHVGGARFGPFQPVAQHAHAKGLHHKHVRLILCRQVAGYKQLTERSCSTAAYAMMAGTAAHASDGRAHLTGPPRWQRRCHSPTARWCECEGHKPAAAPWANPVKGRRRSSLEESLHVASVGWSAWSRHGGQLQQQPGTGAGPSHGPQERA